ncbi:ferritin-like domain-containing protein [Pelagibacterium luteolum]|uniref:Ferritin-like metal-binding protein YciE n=1 Tax=Pelagibacterium luteolum TaxID=440168 RepID=A0A1G8AHB4_9HYPH|nr:ferritin-like domain-containing protein [Pelagibacterium luteolum]SDH20236.1 Ferritin-like metal-binding protein YciE [Pelagibacterium luteolum]
MTPSDQALSLFTTGLKNAHAMEKQALSILKPQASRIESYPDMKARIEQHISETEQQIQRLETIFDQVDESHSGFKDMILSVGGAMAALSHAAAGDEVLKDTFANYAFEHYEIAAYKSLIQIGDRLALGDASALLRQTLDEEERMAQWIDEHIGLVTDQYLVLQKADQQAKR